MPTTKTPVDLKATIVKTVGKLNARSAAASVPLSKLYEKLPDADPFKIRRDVRVLCESGHLKKTIIEAQGVSVYATAKTYGENGKKPAAKAPAKPKKSDAAVLKDEATDPIDR